MLWAGDGEALTLRLSGWALRLRPKVLGVPVPIPTPEQGYEGLRRNLTILVHSHSWGPRVSADSPIVRCGPFKNPPPLGRSTPAHAAPAPWDPPRSPAARYVLNPFPCAPALYPRALCGLAALGKVPPGYSVLSSTTHRASAPAPL